MRNKSFRLGSMKSLKKSLSIFGLTRLLLFNYICIVGSEDYLLSLKSNVKIFGFNIYIYTPDKYDIGTDRTL